MFYYPAGDNIIDKEEYCKAFTGFGLQKDQCEAAYDMFTAVSTT